MAESYWLSRLTGSTDLDSPTRSSSALWLEHKARETSPHGIKVEHPSPATDALLRLPLHTWRVVRSWGFPSGLVCPAEAGRSSLSPGSLLYKE